MIDHKKRRKSASKPLHTAREIAAPPILNAIFFSWGKGGPQVSPPNSYIWRSWKAFGKSGFSCAHHFQTTGSVIGLSNDRRRRHDSQVQRWINNATSWTRKSYILLFQSRASRNVCCTEYNISQHPTKQWHCDTRHIMSWLVISLPPSVGVK